MSDRSPPRPSQATLVIGVSAYVLILGYSLLIAGQFLLGILIGLLLAVLYLLWRFLAAVETLAEAAQRLADQHADNEPDGSTDGVYESETFTD